MTIFKGTATLTGKPVWIFVNAVTAVTTNQIGGAVIHTIDGSTYALKETPDQFFEALKKQVS